MAHNEERNIGRLLERLVVQKTSVAKIENITVVASGCTDGTCEIVLDWEKRDRRIRLITEPERTGKAGAVNIFLSETESPFIVMVGADTMPDHEAVERLVLSLADPEVGMAGARPIPLNSKDSFTDYVVHFLWELHHLVALREAKCGEMVAFRRVFKELPPDTVVDEPQIEALVREAGLRVVYAPEAIVYNIGPDNLGEILMRRRNIIAGYLRLGTRTRYRTSSQRLRWWLLWTVAVRVLKGDEPALWAAGACALEFVARVLGRYDASFSKKQLHIWRPADSTKDLAALNPIKSERENAE